MDGLPPPPPRRPDRSRLPPSAERKPDALEVGLRFGCGAFLGVMLVGWWSWRWLLPGDATHWIPAGTAALVCGLLAVRYGDAFFHGLADWFRWGR